MRAWNVVGWIVVGFIALAVIAAILEPRVPSTVTTDCTYNYTSCTTTVR